VFDCCEELTTASCGRSADCWKGAWKGWLEGSGGVIYRLASKRVGRGEVVQRRWPHQKRGIGG